MRISRIMLCLALGATFALILYFTFRDSSRLAEVSWMPERWGLWLDEHEQFRHFIAMAGFSAMMFALNFDSVFNRSRRRFIRKLRSTRYRRGRLGALLILVYALELAQINMPNRDFDWLDIMNGWGGVMAAWTLWFAWKSRERRSRGHSHDKRHSPINVSSVRFR